jgi:hypothetical protein
MIRRALVWLPVIGLGTAVSCVRRSAVPAPRARQAAARTSNLVDQDSCPPVLVDTAGWTRIRSVVGPVTLLMPPGFSGQNGTTENWQSFVSPPGAAPRDAHFLIRILSTELAESEHQQWVPGPCGFHAPTEERSEEGRCDHPIGRFRACKKQIDGTWAWLVSGRTTGPGTVPPGTWTMFVQWTFRPGRSLHAAVFGPDSVSVARLGGVLLSLREAP